MTVGSCARWIMRLSDRGQKGDNRAQFFPYQECNHLPETAIGFCKACNI